MADNDNKLLLVDPNSRHIVGSVPRELLARLPQDPLSQIARRTHLSRDDRRDHSWANDREFAARPGEDGAMSVAQARPLSGPNMGDNNRGGAVILTPPATWSPGSVIAQTVVEARGGEEAETIDVTLGLTLNPNDNASIGGTLYTWVTALIEWGAGGASYTAEADWLNGTRFSLNASYVRIGARYEPAFFGNGPAALLQASLGYGGRDARPYGLRKTVRSTSGTPTLFANSLSVSSAIRIPKFATTFNLLRGAAAPSAFAWPPFDVMVFFTGTDNAGVQSLSTVYRIQGLPGDAGFPQDLPVPAGTRYMWVYNADAVNDVYFFPVFDLAL
jgi:hypothetical protein